MQWMHQNSGRDVKAKHASRHIKMPVPPNNDHGNVQKAVNGGLAHTNVTSVVTGT